MREQPCTSRNSVLVLGPGWCKLPLMTLRGDDERVKQMAIAVGILLAVACGVVALWLGWMRIPGPVGEFLGMVVGIMSTPFFLEASFVIVGILILIVVNAIQRQREGDLFLTPEELEARDRGATRVAGPVQPPADLP